MGVQCFTSNREIYMELSFKIATFFFFFDQVLLGASHPRKYYLVETNRDPAVKKDIYKGTEKKGTYGDYGDSDVLKNLGLKNESEKKEEASQTLEDDDMSNIGSGPGSGPLPYDFDVSPEEVNDGRDPKTTVPEYK